MLLLARSVGTAQAACDPHRADCPSTHRSHAESQMVMPEAFADAWDMTQLLVDESGHRVDFVARQRKSPQLVQVLDVQLSVDQQLALALPQDEPALSAKLADDLADDLL